MAVTKSIQQFTAPFTTRLEAAGVNHSWGLKYAVGWGLGLWLIGYVLGIILYAVLPASIIGWIIMLIGEVITMWVLVKHIRAESLSAYAILSVVWTVIAVAFD